MGFCVLLHRKVRFDNIAKLMEILSFPSIRKYNMLNVRELENLSDMVA